MSVDYTFENKTLKLAPKGTPPQNVGEWDYGSIGGLKREIAAVREVVEVAVNSPKIFSDYGTVPLERINLR